LLRNIDLDLSFFELRQLTALFVPPLAAQRFVHYACTLQEGNESYVTSADKSPPSSLPDPWAGLRSHTAARIALGRAGTSLPTRELLAFQGDHARAMDAVNGELDRDALAAKLSSAGIESIPLDTQADSRPAYLHRPDFGRRLNENSRQHLRKYVSPHPKPDVIVAIVDGLSAIAAQRHAVPVALALTRRLCEANLNVGAVPLVRYGRVALQDEIGEIMDARVIISLIGERPGLGSPDSLGAYLVYNPHSGNTDAQRNCVSNIRPEGLPYEAAADTLAWLVREALHRKLSGVQLKDDRPIIALPSTGVLPK
jgi:ethanolamine ammonia-lyase small subunit